MQRTRVQAARRLTGLCGQQGIAVGPVGGRRRGEVERAGGAGDADVAGFLLGQPQRLPRALAGRQPVQRAPGAPVVAGLHQGRAAAGAVPAPQQAVEFLQRTAAERQRGARRPVGQRGRAGRCRGVQRVQREPLEAQLPGTAAPAAGHHQLQRCGAAQLLVLGRPPGEADLPLANAQIGGARRRREVGPLPPPDVVAARVHQLQLEGVGRPVAAQPQREGVVRRQLQRQRAPCHRIARDAAEVVVQAGGPAAVAGHPHLHLVGRAGLPAAGIAEVVDQL